MSEFTLSLATSKAREAGVRRTMKAKASCRPTPQATMDSLMARLCLDRRKQAAKIVAIPSSPVKRSMIGSAYHFEDQFAFLRRGSRNTERIFDLLRCLLDIFFTCVVEAAEHCAGFYLVSDLHFEDDADSGINDIFLGIAARADHRRSPADAFSVDDADVAGAR